MKKFFRRILNWFKYRKMLRAYEELEDKYDADWYEESFATDEVCVADEAHASKWDYALAVMFGDRVATDYAVAHGIELGKYNSWIEWLKAVKTAMFAEEIDAKRPMFREWAESFVQAVKAKMDGNLEFDSEGRAMVYQGEKLVDTLEDGAEEVYYGIYLTVEGRLFYWDSRRLADEEIPLDAEKLFKAREIDFALRRSHREALEWTEHEKMSHGVFLTCNS